MTNRLIINNDINILNKVETVKEDNLKKIKHSRKINIKRLIE